MLDEIEGELERVQELERQAQSRSNRLRGMVRDLKATSGLSVTMIEHQQHG